MVTAVGLTVLTFPSVVVASPKTASPVSTPPAFRRSEPIFLVLGNLPWTVDTESLVTALSRELNATILLSVPADADGTYGTLHLQAENNQLTARFESKDGNITQRTVPVPERPSNTRATLVVLAGNVARDEAAELREELKRRAESSKSDGTVVQGPPVPGRASPSGATNSPKPSVYRPFPPSAGRVRPSPPHDQPTVQRGLCTPSVSSPRYWAGVDFVPMVGTSSVARDAVLGASLNVLGGLSGGIQGAQIGGLTNLVRGPVCGLQVGGLVNLTHGVKGLQIGGLVNVTHDVTGTQMGGILNVANNVKGLQIGGIVNATNNVSGLQIGGIVNVTDNVKGLQIGGMFNVTDDVAGVQITGGANLTRDVTGFQLAGSNNVTLFMKGVQMAGAFNLAERVRGLQFSPVNIARTVDGAQAGGAANIARTVNGAQVGVTNIAHTVRGVQVGVVNVANHIRGPQIGVVNIGDDADRSVGLLNIVPGGRYHLAAWAAETGIIMATFKHARRHFHNFYGFGIRPSEGDVRLLLSLGVGGHIPISRRFFFDVDVLAHTVHKTDDTSSPVAFLGQVRAVFGFHLTDRFAVFAGPSFNVGVATTEKDATLSLLGSSSLYSGSDLFVSAWPGASVGVQVF